MGNVNRVRKGREAVDVHGGEDVAGAPIYNVEDPDSGNADERAVDLLVKRRGEALAFSQNLHLARETPVVSEVPVACPGDNGWFILAGRAGGSWSGLDSWHREWWWLKKDEGRGGLCRSTCCGRGKQRETSRSADPQSKSCRLLASNKLRNLQIVTILSLYFTILKILNGSELRGSSQIIWVRVYLRPFKYPEESEHLSSNLWEVAFSGFGGQANSPSVKGCFEVLADCELRHQMVPGGNCVRARQPKSIPSDLDSSEEEREYERQYARYLQKLDRYDRKQAELRYISGREEAQHQWKAASARYYERHPEVKEKKRLQAAEKRYGDGRPLISLLPEMPVVFSAAKKLARRRWDPPKQIKVLVEEDLDSGITQRPGPPLPPRHRRTREEQQLGNFSDTPDVDLIPDVLHVTAGTYTHDDILELWKEAESGGHAVDIPSPQLRNGEWPVHPPAYADENLAAESLLDLRGQGSVMRAETREPPPIWASLVPEYESSDDEAAFAGTLK
ncbi:hypothetical protein DFH08DRAFT_797017 [Mycena albidolilacea]|uniref:Uncharacterized protein n=1 Tax=Mycena albidolilacea TaxID=1033008 RepID=A0AAD7F7J1_9AGAR|nr:hypothetical protein DFH08DRAFT_797017 [Mycena albidolilacea]